MPNIEKGRITLEYVRKHKDTLNDTDIARKLRADYPKLFRDNEDARNLVRTYTGKKGAKNRLIVKNDDCFSKSSPLALGGTRGKFKPKILIFDIETSPHLVWVWGMFKQNIGTSQVVKTTQVLSYVAKFIGEKKFYSDSMQGCQDDKRLCKSLWKLFDKADVIVGHNGQAFDVKTMNARWVHYGFNPPSPYKQVDTLTLAKGMFRFPRNKLESIAQYLGVGQKMEHEGFGLWTKCMNGDKKAWKRMMAYNKQDVVITEKVYLKLRSWDKRHPNVSLMYDDSDLRCMVCGSSNVTQMKKNSYTSAREFVSYQCDNCGKIMRDRACDKNETTINGKTKKVTMKAKKTFAHSL